MANRLTPNGYILGLDVGEKRIGVAVASLIAKLPRPLKELQNSPQVFDQIKELVNQESVELVVVGIPRNLDGAETAQSAQIRAFGVEVGKHLTVPIEYADESLSSVRADELSRQGVHKEASRDSLAACFILEEFLVKMDKKVS
jgi:putative Holliday junction resolvase